MELTPRDKDKLLLFTAGLLAERRKASTAVPHFDRVMERLFEAIDLIDEGSGVAARAAVCDACEMLLRREEGAHAWPRK